MEWIDMIAVQVIKFIICKLRLRLCSGMSRCQGSEPAHRLHPRCGKERCVQQFYEAHLNWWAQGGLEWIGGR